MDKNTIRVYVDSLNHDEVYKELQAVYMQMEKCRLAILGKDVKPVKKENGGLNIGFELFRLCNKAGHEKSVLEGLLRDCSDFAALLLDNFAPIEPSEDYKKELIDNRKKRERKYNVGDEVWYIYDGVVQNSKIKEVLGLTGGKWSYATGVCNGILEEELFPSMGDLFSYLKKSVVKT